MSNGVVVEKRLLLSLSWYGIIISFSCANADAMPLNSNWLARLVETLKELRVAAAFGCQIPDKDCYAACPSC